MLIKEGEAGTARSVGIVLEVKQQRAFARQGRFAGFSRRWHAFRPRGLALRRFRGLMRPVCYREAHRIRAGVCRIAR